MSERVILSLRFMLRPALIIGLSFTLTLTLAAQEDPEPTPDQITDAQIRFDQVVNDTITERSIFDLWRFRANAGDIVFLQMTAADGLAPLLGLSRGGDIIARSDVNAEGESLPDAAPNGVAELEFIVPESGEYVAVPTRVGNADGTTTGSYTLTLRRANPGSDTRNTFQDVTFRCGESLAATALTLEFGLVDNETGYRFSVYGLDGFQPVIRVAAGLNDELQDCSSDSQTMANDSLTLPDGTTIQLEDTQRPINAARFTLRGENLARARLTIGSVDDAPGRYVLVIEGFTLDPLTENIINLGIGPLAAETTEVSVYMVRGAASRIDPLLTYYIEEDDPSDEAQNIVCDDAGRFDCAEVPAFSDHGVTFGDSNEIIGGMFDAGLRLAPGNPDPIELGFSSRSRAGGTYTIFIIGELPPRAGSD